MHFHHKLFHNLFKITIFLKGMAGVFEILGGIILLFFATKPLEYVLDLILSHELVSYRGDLIANALLSFVSDISRNVQIFGAIALLAFGAINILLVFGLWRRKLWAFPAASIILIVLILYQIYNLYLSQAIPIVGFIVFDMVILALILNEYKYHILQHHNGGV